MFKRFIVRSLIITQVYGNLFQGVLHADITQGYLVRDEIYLHSSAGRDGGLRLALGTNAASGSDLEVLKLLEIPSYNTLKRVEPWPTIPLPTSANPLDTYHDEPIEAADSVFAPLAIVDSLDDSLKSLSSLGLEAIDVRAVDQQICRVAVTERVRCDVLRDAGELRVGRYHPLDAARGDRRDGARGTSR